jgi:DNA gyrase/topoisomerase IV subunit B
MSESTAPLCDDITARVIRALVLYSLAEAQSGHCKTIRIDARNGSFRVEDDGRGHAIERTVAGLPYLGFIYTHLDHPFAATRDAPVQLQGIGLSLVNALCSELTVIARRPDATLRLSFRAGRLCGEVIDRVPSAVTGNTVSGTVDRRLRPSDAVAEDLGPWLEGVLAVHPALTLSFNGRALHAGARGDA